MILKFFQDRYLLVNKLYKKDLWIMLVQWCKFYNKNILMPIYKYQKHKKNLWLNYLEELDK